MRCEQDPRRKDGHDSELTKINLDDVKEYIGEEKLNSILADGMNC